MKSISRFFQIALIFIMVILVLGVNACPQEKKEGNTGGLSVKLVENAPPLNVIVGQSFKIYADLQNSGEYNVDIGTAKVYLSGIKENVDGIKPSLSNKNLLGPGSIERMVFADAAKSSLVLKDPFTVTMLLTSCYKYGGAVQSELCIASSNTSKICSLAGEKITSDSNTGEPVQISSLTESIVGNKLQISFNLVNSGKGEIYLPNTDCDKLQAKDLDESNKKGKIKVSVRTSEDFTCELQSLEPPYGSIISTLEGSSSVGKVVCEKKISADDEDHKTPIRIILEYVYVESSPQNIIITPS